MLISIVSGTYNRLSHLRGMIESVRAQIPRHIDYEIVIVDGGSTDGTIDWLRKQSDVRLLEHGALRGAIKAFCDGAEIARGDYVVMANDDIEFHPLSLMRAVAYLETHRTCGGVAFADNRISKMTEHTGYRTASMPAVSPSGESIGVVYAQVGMFRRWLGEKVGWWGADDPIMRKALTYGGDNYLSSRCWELGYSIDAVEGCTVEDLIPRDNLRAINTARGRQDGETYYHRFPRGPRIQLHPKTANPQRERMRIVAMPIYEPRFPGRENKEYGLSESLAKTGLCWEIDFVNEDFNLPAIIGAWQPHVLITQIHAVNEITVDLLKSARRTKPDIVIVNWNGDAHEKGLIAPSILEVLREVDLQTVVNAAVLPVYKKEGIPAAYWQIGYKDPAFLHVGECPAHEVLFLGNCYNAEREALVAALQESEAEVALYGSCPGAIGNTHYDFAKSRALYERCTIAISDTFPNTEAFVSNRLFQALSAGAFVLQQYSPRLDEFNGLVAGEHYIEWRTLDELKTLIAEWRQPECAERRKAIAESGKAYVRAHFNYDAQVRKLWNLLPV